MPIYRGAGGQSAFVDTSGLTRLARGLREAGPAVQLAFRTAAAAGGASVLAVANANASYSTQIPASGSVQLSRAGNVRITWTAPDAAPIENDGRGNVRHPVFGNRNVWTSKNSHPAFAEPALAAVRPAMLAGIESAVRDAVESSIDSALG